MGTDNGQFRKPSPESLDAGYETSGISVKGLAIFVASLIICAAIIHAGVWYLFAGYLHLDREKDRSDSALTDQQVVGQFNQANHTNYPAASPGQPPPPRLQPTAGLDPARDPQADLQQMYRQEDEFFRRLGWKVDPESHVQTEIPASVITAVENDQTQRRGNQK
jgi:hypothetical protein